MRKNFLKRTLAGVLSAVTLCSSMAVSVPTAFAAEEDNKASAIEIKVGENYNVADKGVSKAWFQQNGAPPVSYTHLDVYKRQLSGSVLKEMKMNIVRK